MKKKVLKKLTLYSNEITKKEQNSIVGGDWVWDSQLQDYIWELPEVVVYGNPSTYTCSKCAAFYNQSGFFDYQAENPILGSILTYYNLICHACCH